jgi:hypothetical protein
MMWVGKVGGGDASTCQRVVPCRSGWRPIFCPVERPIRSITVFYFFGLRLKILERFFPYKHTSLGIV